MDHLRFDKPEQGSLQTELQALMLKRLPHEADSLLASNQLTHYHREHISYLCESEGLFLRALDLYDHREDMKRVLVSMPFNYNEDEMAEMVKWFGGHNKEWVLKLLDAMLLTDIQVWWRDVQKANIVV